MRRMMCVPIGASLVAVLLAGCQEPAGQASAAPPPDLQRAVQGLCEAGALAASGDVEGAAAVFQNESHDYLHEIAARLAGENREVAAELLEDKQRLEAAIRDPAMADAATVTELLTEVQRDLGAAAAAEGLPVPTCEGAA